MLRHIDGGYRVWRVRGAAYEQHHIVETNAFGGGYVIVWAYFSNDSKLAMHPNKHSTKIYSGPLSASQVS